MPIFHKGGNKPNKQFFTVNDVPSISTPHGTSMENDEMRKLVTQLNQTIQNIQGQIDALKQQPKIPETPILPPTQSDIVTTKPAERGTGRPIPLAIIVEHNSVVVVRPARILNFIDGVEDYTYINNDEVISYVSWKIEDAGEARANIRAYVKVPATRYRLDGAYGIITGSPIDDIPSSATWQPGSNSPLGDWFVDNSGNYIVPPVLALHKFTPGTTGYYTGPATLFKGIRAIHFIGTGARFEPPYTEEEINKTPSVLRFKPTLETYIYAAYLTKGTWTGADNTQRGRGDVQKDVPTLIAKVVAHPLLQISSFTSTPYDADYIQTIENIKYSSSQHITRIHFYDNDSVSWDIRTLTNLDYQHAVAIRATVNISVDFETSDCSGYDLSHYSPVYYQPVKTIINNNNSATILTNKIYTYGINVSKHGDCYVFSVTVKLLHPCINIHDVYEVIGYTFEPATRDLFSLFIDDKAEVNELSGHRIDIWIRYLRAHNRNIKLGYSRAIIQTSEGPGYSPIDCWLSITGYVSAQHNTLSPIYTREILNFIDTASVNWQITDNESNNSIDIRAHAINNNYEFYNIGIGPGEVFKIKESGGANLYNVYYRTLQPLNANTTITTGENEVVIGFIPYDAENIDCPPPFAKNGTAKIYKDIYNNKYRFRTIHGAKLVRVIEYENCITILGKEPVLEYAQCATGEGEIIYQRLWRDDGSGDDWGELVYQLKKIKAGNNITIDNNNCDIVINATVYQYDGTNIDCTPPISGNGTAGVYKDTVGTTHRFRSIHGLKLVKVIQYGDCIAIVGKEPVLMDRTCATGEASVYHSFEWFDDGSGDTYGQLRYYFRKLKAGTNVTITQNDCDIIISATDTDTQYLGNNLGTGAQVFKNLTGTNPKTFNYRTLVAGSNVTINTNANDEIVISATDTDTQYLMANVGSGTGIWRDTTGTNPKTFNLKTLVAGTNVTITSGADTITISATDTDTQYLGNNLGTGAQVFKNLTGTNPKTFNYRTLVAGSNVTINTNANDEIVISATVPTYDGTNVLCDWFDSNTQSGPGSVYKDTVGTTHRFRSIIGQGVKVNTSGDCILIKTQFSGTTKPCATGLSIFYDDSYDNTTGTHTLRFYGIKGSNGISVTSDGCDIIISNDCCVDYTGNNLGTGAQVFKNLTGTNPKTFNYRTLVAGSNVTINTNANDEIVISATDTDTQYLMANVGTGTGIWRDTTGTNPKTFNLKSLVAGTNVTITSGTDTITISATDTQYLGANIGSGAQVFKNLTGTNPKTFNFRTLVAGSNVTINTNANDEIVISATDTDTQYLMANVGTGTGIWRDTTGTNPKTFNLKSLVAGTNVTITSGTDTITISATDTDTQYLGANLGTGAQVFKNITGTNPKTFNFRTLVAGSNVTINTNANDEIVISATDTDTQYLMANVGTGTGIWRDTTGTNPKTFNLKSLVAGTNVTITSGTDTITISATDTDTQYLGANLGTGAQVFKNITGTNPKTFNFRTLVAGSNVTINTNANDEIVISATDTDTQYLMANVGTGAGIWRDTTGTNPKTFNLKTLVAGTNVTITSGADTITISATDTDTQYLGANLGSGAQVFKNITGTNPKTFNFRTLVAGSNVTINTNANDEIVISATDTDTQYLMANVGTGTGIWRDTTGTNPKTFNLKSLVAGTNVTITSGTDTITISATDTQYLGANLGTGAQVFKNITGTNPKTFNFRTLVAGSNVTINTNANDEIVISATDTDTQYLMANVGTGAGIWRDTTGTNPKTFNLKTLVAGTNVTITSGADTITISATDTDTQYLGANLGTGAQVFKNITGTNPKTFNFRTLVAGSNVTINTNANDEIVISATDTDTQYLMANVGTGAGIWRDTTGTNPKTFNLKTLVAGTNVTITSGADTITISATDTDTQYLGANLGSGAQVFKNITGTNPKTFNYRTLVAGSNVTINTNANDEIVISATDTDTQYLMANVGTGTGIWRDTTGTNPKTFNIKSLVAGPGIIITSSQDDITIATTGASYTPETNYIKRYHVRGMHDVNGLRLIGQSTELRNLRKYYSIYWDNVYEPHIDEPDLGNKCTYPEDLQFAVLRIAQLPNTHEYFFFVTPEPGFYFINARLRYNIQSVPPANIYPNVPVNSRLILVRGLDNPAFYDDENNFNSYYGGRWSVLNCDTSVINAQQLAQILNLDFNVTGYPITTIELVGSDIIYLESGMLFTVLFNFDYVTNEPTNIIIEEGYIDIHRLTDTNSVLYDPCSP
ncbi:MAG: hypothetical protein KatS3mg083_098 [Candidatus Dojkabacteria bacterium]|nr:MAG: hypothetical protein KatS3mg083_098 [Candidatus Dojkabacteria bacterium]